MAAINGSADLAALAASAHSVIPHAKTRPGAAQSAIGTVDGVHSDVASGNAQEGAHESGQSSARTGQGRSVSGETGTSATEPAQTETAKKDYHFALDWASDTWGIPSLPEGIWSLNADNAEGQSATSSQQQSDHQPVAQSPNGADNAADDVSESSGDNDIPGTGDTPDTVQDLNDDDTGGGEEPAAQDSADTNPQTVQTPDVAGNPDTAEASEQSQATEQPEITEQPEASEQPEESEVIENSKVSGTSEQPQSPQSTEAMEIAQAAQDRKISPDSGHTPDDEESSSPVSAQHPPIEQASAVQAVQPDGVRPSDERVETPSDAPSFAVSSDVPSPDMRESDMRESGTQAPDTQGPDSDEPTQVIDRDAIGTETGPLPYNIPPAEMTEHTAAIYESTNEFPFAFEQSGEGEARAEEPLPSDKADTTGQLPVTEEPTGDNEAAVAIPADANRPAYRPNGEAPQTNRNAASSRVKAARPVESPAAGKTATPVRATIIIVVVVALLVCAGIVFALTRHHGTSATQPTASATASASAPASSSAGASASASSSSPSAAATPSPAGVYTNDAIGYRVSIPDGYVWHEETDNGATRTFTDDSIGMTIKVSGASNTTGATVSSEYSACASGHSVSYHLLSGDIMVCSYAENGTITYVKEIVTQQSILTLRFDYAQSAQEKGAAVIDEVFPTFVSTC